MQASGPRRINPQPVTVAGGPRLGDLPPPSGPRSGPAGGNSFTFATPTSGPLASVAAAPPPQLSQLANGVPEAAPGPAGNMASATGAKRKAPSQADGAGGAKGPKRVAPERVPTVPDSSTPASLGGTPRARVGTPVQGASGAAQDVLQQQPLMPALPVVQQVGPLLLLHPSLPVVQQVSPLLQQVSPPPHPHLCLCNAACAAWVAAVKQAAPLRPSSAPWPALAVLWLQASWLLHLHALLGAAARPVSALGAASAHLCVCLCPGCTDKSQRLRQVQLEAHQLPLWLQQEHSVVWPISSVSNRWRCCRWQRSWGATPRRCRWDYAPR